MKGREKLDVLAQEKDDLMRKINAIKAARAEKEPLVQMVSAAR